MFVKVMKLFCFHIMVFLDFFPIFSSIYIYLNQISCLQFNVYRNNTLLLYTKIKAVFSRCQDVPKDQNTRDNSAWTAENRYLMHGVCIPHSTPRAWEQQE